MPFQYIVLQIFTTSVSTSRGYSLASQNVFDWMPQEEVTASITVLRGGAENVSA